MRITSPAFWWTQPRACSTATAVAVGRRDSFCRTLSPGEVPASLGFTPAMARIATNPAESRGFLWHAVTPPRRGCDLPVPTRRPHAGSRRAHANRLCSWSLPARLAHTVGLSAPGFASSRLGHQHGLRRLYVRRIVFPLEVNLYGRSLSASAP